MEFVLWATKIGAPEWEEELITSTTNKARLQNHDRGLGYAILRY